MVDIETMGTGVNSSILSIAAVKFDLDTGFTGDEFYVKIDLQSCLDKGLEMNANTVVWWMRQSEEARKELFQDKGGNLLPALVDFKKVFNEKSLVWGNSARFDLGVLENAFNKCEMDIPWRFYNERDVRTLVSFRPEIKREAVFEGVPHNALDDCKHQIKYCSEIWNDLN